MHLCRSFFTLAAFALLTAPASAEEPVRDPRVPRGPQDEPTGGMLTPEEEATFAAHVRVLGPEERAMEDNKRVLRFTAYLAENASPGCAEELDDVLALGETSTLPPEALFTEECNLEFAIYKEEFNELENIEYAKTVDKRRKLMQKMQSAGDMSGIEEAVGGGGSGEL